MKAYIFFFIVGFVSPVVGQEWTSQVSKSEMVFSEYYIKWEELAPLQIEKGGSGSEVPWSKTIAKVEWNEHCEISLKTEVIFPTLANRQLAPKPILLEFDRMVSAIKLYENMHVNISEIFANEIARHKCPENSEEIRAYWDEQRIELSKNSENGRVFGVYFEIGN